MAREVHCYAALNVRYFFNSKKSLTTSLRIVSRGYYFWLFIAMRKVIQEYLKKKKVINILFFFGIAKTRYLNKNKL